MLVKICGITTPDAARCCLDAGADMIGFVYYPSSPRHIAAPLISKILDSVEQYRKSGRKTVLVIVDKIPDQVDPRIDYVQLHGDYKPNVSQQTITVIKDQQTIQNPNPATDPNKLYLLEISKGALPGGNGKKWDWSIAKQFCKKYKTILAGGITSENVQTAIVQANPYGIDVSSGVEKSPGIKDGKKVEQLIKQVRMLY
ncbi:MAG: phosphoribosylanthranilate isomerase [Planctomycetaceae bacterium]|jgi:phosphoribosylanthranilate isomerase|nr:phosphoribosylanthranilate isomerase [Planctomycetaceae bacterium]